MVEHLVNGFDRFKYVFAFYDLIRGYFGDDFPNHAVNGDRMDSRLENIVSRGHIRRDDEIHSQEICRRDPRRTHKEDEIKKFRPFTNRLCNFI